MKFYIRFGNTQKIVQTGNVLAACVQAYKSYFNSRELPKTLPTFFRVSQRGFDEHEDDELVGVDEIIKLMMMSNKAKKELNALNKKEKS